MACTNDEAIQRVADKILKVLLDQNRIDNNPAQCDLLKATIDLHWGSKIKKILKVLTPVGARQTISYQFIGDILKMWKTQIISCDLLPEDFQAFETSQMSANQLMPGNQEFYRHLVANHKMSQQVIKLQLNISFK